jgi:hypothetical protein
MRTLKEDIMEDELSKWDEKVRQFVKAGDHEKAKAAMRVSKFIFDTFFSLEVTCNGIIMRTK